MIVPWTRLIIDPMQPLKYSPPDRKGIAGDVQGESGKSLPEAPTRDYDMYDAALEAVTTGADALHLYGFNPIRAGGSPVTNEMVDKMRDQLGI